MNEVKKGVWEKGGGVKEKEALGVWGKRKKGEKEGNTHIIQKGGEEKVFQKLQVQTLWIGGGNMIAARGLAANWEVKTKSPFFW